MEPEYEMWLELEHVAMDVLSVLGILSVYVTETMGGLPHRRLETSRRSYSICDRIPRQLAHLNEIIFQSDVQCMNNLRMNRNAFGRLSELVATVGGLCPRRNVSINEQLAMFVSVLAHHKKNRIVGHNFIRSGWTVSTCFRNVLKSILKLIPLLYAKPIAITENHSTERWRHFKGCLGALDGTYIPVRVLAHEKARYRNRKGEISVNVLGVCDVDMKFVYVLSGWEGSAADSRVLRDAVTRTSGLKVPRGCYYLCDNGYANSEGFLAPYKGTRYHLNEWAEGAAAPRSKAEFFNMKHARARSVIERAFGLLKARWAILRSPSFYPIKVQNSIILACCVLHNFVRMEMEDDPLEQELGDANGIGDLPTADYVDTVESTPQWTTFRETLALSMFNEHRRSGQ